MSIEKDLLTYYNKAFPIELIYKWLCFEDGKIDKREISFTLIDETYVRPLVFHSLEDIIYEMHKNVPVEIDMGRIYIHNAKERYGFTTVNSTIKEIVIDIDLSDYDNVRTCCTKADICSFCWKFVRVSCKILDAILRNDFGYNHLLWVFSGRRGVHCWICDKKAMLSNRRTRNAIIMYIKSIKSSLKKRAATHRNRLHPAQVRSLRIIDKYFVDVIMKEQNVLCNNEGLDHFLRIVPSKFRMEFQSEMKKFDSSIERWQMFLKLFEILLEKGEISKVLKEEIKFYYMYPRLDEIVSRSIGHLLKVPFSINRFTKKISLPFSIDEVDEFDPSTVPTIDLILKDANHERFKKSVEVFNKFLQNLKK